MISIKEVLSPILDERRLEQKTNVHSMCKTCLYIIYNFPVLFNDDFGFDCYLNVNLKTFNRDPIFIPEMEKPNLLKVGYS